MTYSLVRMPFAQFRFLQPGELADTAMLVDRDFVPFLVRADAAAGTAGVVMLVNQTFRRADEPVQDARVPPASNSQHLVGRAIDANLLAEGRVWGAGLDDRGTAISPTSCAAVGRFLKLMQQAGFRWGGGWTPADRIHWDAWIDPKGAEYATKYRLFQQPAPAVPPVPPPDAGTGQPPVAGGPPDGTPSTASPAWFARDVQRRARWLPAEIGTLGVDGAYRQRWATLPDDIRATLGRWAIPPWMVALIPTDPGRQDEIWKQFRFMVDLAGDPPDGPIAARMEQLLIFGGSAQLPTPGDNATGASLGAEGCTAAMSKYVFAQLKAEFPGKLAGLSEALTRSQFSGEMLALFRTAAGAGIVTVATRPFAALRPSDVRPGSLMIAQKPGGTHVFGWTRVPAGWRWDPGDRMAIGNTGLPQFGDRLSLAQEYVTERPDVPGELAHNRHGPINSTNVVYAGGGPDLSDPRTNVYGVQGSNFILINFPGPAPFPVPIA